MLTNYIVGLSVGIIGSLIINHCSDTLPIKKSIFSIPKCPYCLSSYSPDRYLLKLPCRHCSAPFPLRNGIVLLAFSLFSIIFMVIPVGNNYPYWMNMVLIAYCSIVLVIDIEHHLVLHKVALTGVIIMMVIGFQIHGIHNTLIGGLSGFMIMFALYLLGVFYVKTVNKLRRADYSDTGLGFGDVTLSGVMGLLLAWPGIIAGLLIAIVSGGLFSLIYILMKIVNKKYQANSAIPYAPFIIIGSLVLVYFPN